MEKYTKKWLKTILVQFIIYIIMISILAFISVSNISCTKEEGVPTFRENIAGSYYINKSGEILTFDTNGIWYYDICVAYPEEDIYGNYTVDENNKSTIYCFYYIESEDIDLCDTMKVTYSNNTNVLIATGVPTHGNEQIELIKQ